MVKSCTIVAMPVIILKEGTRRQKVWLSLKTLTVKLKCTECLREKQNTIYCLRFIVDYFKISLHLQLCYLVFRCLWINSKCDFRCPFCFALYAQFSYGHSNIGGLPHSYFECFQRDCLWQYLLLHFLHPNGFHKYFQLW